MLVYQRVAVNAMIRDEHCYGSAMTLPHRSLDDRPSKLIFEERINIKWPMDIYGYWILVDVPNLCDLQNP
jgi:hypothetical protein